MAGTETPPFWYADLGWQARLLAPASWAYGAVARSRLDKASPPAADVPVLCVGNLTVGGSGKTPTALSLAAAARQAGYKPGFLTRGYGGSHARPHLVDSAHDTARSVGDEALLLTREAPTVVARDRAAGAARLIAEGIDFIIMDDGFQSRTLHYDYALLALDARRGIGNGAVLPAGPLRAPLKDQLRRCDAVLRIGEGTAGDPVVRAAARAGKAIFHATVVPHDLPALEGRHCLAYSGIGEPEKFYDTLAAMGHWVSVRRNFADHHEFTPEDARELLQRADADRLVLVTTEKDAARLSHIEGPLAELRRRSHVLPVELVFELETTAGKLIRHAAERYRERRIRNGSSRAG